LEATFVVDDQQRVREWSSAASALLQLTEQDAVGRPCFALVDGSDSFGRPACGDDCPAFESLRRGNLTAGQSLILHRPDGSTRRLGCHLVALPQISGGALVTLAASRSENFGTEADAGTATPVGSPDAPVSGITQELAAVATISTLLLGGAIEHDMEDTLDMLRQAAGADSAELFLAEPNNGDLLLTLYRGPFRAAFEEITRFRPGEGFPGIVQASRTPLVTQQLADDPRYLRSRVKHEGYRSYVCVPVFGKTEIIGVLNLAARSPGFDVERARRLLEWTIAPLSNALEADFLRARATVASTPEDPGGSSHGKADRNLRAMLKRMMQIGKATAGALFTHDADTGGMVRQAEEGEFAELTCPGGGTDSHPICPAFADGRGMVLHGPRSGWPTACRQIPAAGALAYCLPLIVGDERVGVVQLGREGRIPAPATRYLAPLLDAAVEAGRVVAEARKAVPAPERAAFPDPQRTNGHSLPPVSGVVTQHRPARGGTESNGTDRPHLEMECLGEFRLHRDGELIAPETFKRRGALTLLKILLVQNRHPLSGEALMETLWPGAEPGAAKNRLHVLVHSLRQAVEPGPRRRPWTYICTRDDGYYLNATPSQYLDIEEFRSSIALGTRTEKQGDFTRAAKAYQTAVALYRGDLFQDDPYAQWCWWEREHLRETVLDTLRRLSSLAAAKGDWDTSINGYRRALRIDPLREDNHRGLMHTLWSAGREGEALRQYRLCRDLVKRELDMQPLPETERLYGLIRSGDSSPQAPSTDL
jgi:DNA-binding SARP family transcriptional activator